MRNKIIIGNWKMNLTYDEGKDQIMHLNTWLLAHKPNCGVKIAPSFLYLDKFQSLIGDSRIQFLAQDISAHKTGAYTGEVAAEQLASISIPGTLIGHSERRTYFGETNKITNDKIKQTFAQKLEAVLCVGETLAERQAGEEFKVINDQLVEGLKDISEEELQLLTIAYEPVWAIGTGEVATPEQAQDMHAFIRKVIKNLYGEAAAEKIHILYGGSLKPDNAVEILHKPDVDGGLVGGASLKYQDFIKIIQAAS